MPRPRGAGGRSAPAAGESPTRATSRGRAESPSRDRGLTEAAGLAILVSFTVVVTLVVGLNVLVVSDLEDGPIRANFTFEYIDANNALIVTHEEGDEIPAGQLAIEDPNGDARATWAELARYNETRPVGPGEPVQVSGQTEYGQPVRSIDSVVVYHDDGTNRTELSRWSGRTE